MQKFFDNTITIQANPAAVADILANPQRLVNWDEEINTVDTTANHTFAIHRHQDAINAAEELTVSNKGDVISYHVQGDRLNYQVDFMLTENGDDTVVVQTVAVDSAGVAGVPLKLMRPVARRGFMQNLRVLATVAESGMQL
ncbi:SRPBCC family protein [Lacticaseibacillus pantheris]